MLVAVVEDLACVLPKSSVAGLDRVPVVPLLHRVARRFRFRRRVLVRRYVTLGYVTLAGQYAKRGAGKDRRGQVLHVTATDDGKW